MSWLFSRALVEEYLGANSLGGDLPDRAEQALLFQYLPEEFQKAAYWSNTQHAADSYYAWFQNFDYGSQSYNDKSADLRASAVRRVFVDIGKE